MTQFKRFGHVLRDLLIDAGQTTKLGNPNWSSFATYVRGIHYETLRKAVTGERRPTPELMERCAETLGVAPEVFVEYRIWKAQRSFDPAEVGPQAALAALNRWNDLSL